jgi:DNA-binding LacI/PurR family transcriptional regulator
MYQTTKYLLSLNHRAIAFVSGHPEWEFSKVRMQGIQQALEEAGLTLDSELYRWGDSTIDEGFRVTNSLLQLSSEKRPTAILAYNDLMAIGTLHAIRSAGLKVPDDISVVGFDDIDLALHTNPPLTTVAQPQYRIGQLAIQKLSDSLNDYETTTEGVMLLECSLVVRESTGLCARKA